MPYNRGLVKTTVHLKDETQSMQVIKSYVDYLITREALTR